MTLNKIELINEERYIIRDVKTKEHYKRNYGEKDIIIGFRSLYVAKDYIQRMPYGLGQYYEIVNSKTEEVVYPTKKEIKKNWIKKRK